jgi:hypothetical protein
MYPFLKMLSKVSTTFILLTLTTSTLLSTISSNAQQASDSSSSSVNNSSVSSETSSIGSSSSNDTLLGVQNFSLEEGTNSITVRWTSVDQADSYKIYLSENKSNISATVPIVVQGCPSAGVNRINSCEYKIDNIPNGFGGLRYVDIKANKGDIDSEFTGKVKFAIPFEIVIDDDAQYDQGCPKSPVCKFTPYDYRQWSTSRGNAPFKNDSLYENVGEDKYDSTIGSGFENKAIWQTGLPLNGNYDIFVTYKKDSSNAALVKYIIGKDSHVPTPNNNSSLSVPINQKLNYGFGSDGLDGKDGGWIRLGNYFFDNQLGVVTLNGDSSSGEIQIDAIAFQKNDMVTSSSSSISTLSSSTTSSSNSSSSTSLLSSSSSRLSSSSSISSSISSQQSSSVSVASKSASTISTTTLGTGGGFYDPDLINTKSAMNAVRTGGVSSNTGWLIIGLMATMFVILSALFTLIKR